MALEPDLRDAYLQRLGLEAERPSVLDGLWVRCLASHRAWEAAGRPESPRRPRLTTRSSDA